MTTDQPRELPCFADGDSHKAHLWSFGGEESLRCPGMEATPGSVQKVLEDHWFSGASDTCVCGHFADLDSAQRHHLMDEFSVIVASHVRKALDSAADALLVKARHWNDIHMDSERPDDGWASGYRSATFEVAAEIVRTHTT